MNTREFISSGILEAYVMGVASDTERVQVETMAAKYPEVKAELEAIENAMSAYATKHAVEPPAHLRDKILNEIAFTPRLSSGGEETKSFNTKPSQNEEKNYRVTTVFAIAASVALLISIPLNIYLYTKVSSNESKIAAMSDEQKKMITSIHDSAIAYQSMRNEHYVMTDPMFKVVKLNGLKVSPDARAIACWCPDSKELYFEPQKLPAAPKGMQYELWAIVDGKPVNAGMIKMDSGMQKMNLIANASAFAVTLEKEGGSDAPHGDMYVMGSI